MQNDWTLQDKYVLMTGATDGIGLAAAEALAARGARIGLIARNRAKAEAVARRLEEVCAGRTVDVFIADLASQRDVRRVAAEVLARCPRVDVLANNAGAMFESRLVTAEGVEMTWAVNHLAPFLLTTLLLDRLRASGSARVVTTASHGHKMAKAGIDFADLGGERHYRPFGKWTGGATLRYGETKLANILFTAELARRTEGTGVTVHCFDPGLVATNFNQNNGWMARATMAAMRVFSRTAAQGAETLVWLAASPVLPGDAGGYYVDKQLQVPSAAARDTSAARRLWEVSEEQTRDSAERS